METDKTLNKSEVTQKAADDFSRYKATDVDFEGREKYELDIDRMINEGLGGGYISDQNGLVDEPKLEDNEALS